MAVARKEQFQRKEIDVAEFAKALAHPARVAILTALAQKRECICGDLVIDLPIAQSTVSQHLKVLKELGLIKGTVDGPRSLYCIDWKTLDRYQRKLNDWSQMIGKFR